jgi:alpha-N-arabinofuranosidase
VLSRRIDRVPLELIIQHKGWTKESWQDGVFLYHHYPVIPQFTSFSTPWSYEIMAGIDPYAAAPVRTNTADRATFDHPKTLENKTVYISPKSLVYPEGNEIVSDKLYSGFIEHLGRGIYGGIVDDDQHPSPDEVLVRQDDGSELTKGRLGWRKDVMDIIGKEGELEMPMLRWPGG